jgi:hypothetical protein
VEEGRAGWVDIGSGAIEMKVDRIFGGKIGREFRHGRVEDLGL